MPLQNHELMIRGLPNRAFKLNLDQTIEFQRIFHRQFFDQRLKEANLKRQQDLRADTDRLLQLATELKAAVDKSNENLLSLDVLRKADEVEKLARRVREKMKDGIGPGPRTEPTGNPRVPGRPPG